MIAERRLAPDWVTLPSGTFVMGESPDDKFATDTERPAHTVALPRAFALARFPVTVSDYRAFAPEHAPGDNPEWPAVNVSWDEANAYCAWGRRETGAAWRLPTEAEWEYACRSGHRAAFAGTDELTTADANFLYAEDGRRVGPGGRTAAGRYAPNGFGLFDLLGNVCEWVADAWHPDFWGAPSDGSPWLDDGPRRVIRGGAWDYLPRLLRCAWRDALPRGSRRDNVGFRLALSWDR
jgi:formylglycine-generating enzyme required for sulfatase activity